jgi:hypothetical protein
VIDIDDRQRQRMSETDRAVRLALQGLLEAAPVPGLGQPVRARQLLQGA